MSVGAWNLKLGGLPLCLCPGRGAETAPLIGAKAPHPPAPSLLAQSNRSGWKEMLANCSLHIAGRGDAPSSCGAHF